MLMLLLESDGENRSAASALTPPSAGICAMAVFTDSPHRLASNRDWARVLAAGAAGVATMEPPDFSTAMVASWVRFATPTPIIVPQSMTTWAPQ
ncbi:hypothetical protein D9M68_825010 [compost metagenome]